MIVLIVSPSVNPDGRKASSNRGQPFDGYVDGRRIVSRSTQPFLDAARLLVAQGVDPNEEFVMRHPGPEHDALRSTIGYAAKLTVHNVRGGKPVFREWKERDSFGGLSIAGSPPMSLSDLEATQVASEV